MWRVAASVLKMQSRVKARCGYPAWGFGGELNPHCMNTSTTCLTLGSTRNWTVKKNPVMEQV
jgi:hypothetical protein